MNDDQATPAVDPQVALLAALDDTPQDEPEQEEGEAPEVVEPETPDDTEEDDEEDDEGSPKSDQKYREKYRVSFKNDDGSDGHEDLTIAELVAGNMRNKNYTQGKQQQADAIRQNEQKTFDAVQQINQQAQSELRVLRNVLLNAAAPELQNVNWQQLASEDPARYVQLQARQQQLGGVLSHFDEQGQQLKNQQEQQEAAFKAQEREQTKQDSLAYLQREIPGFNLQAEAAKLVDFARKSGVPQIDLDEIKGYQLHLLRDAMQWRQLQTARPKAMQKVIEAPKVIKPAAPQPKKSNQAALQRLQSTGRASDLVAFL